MLGELDPGRGRADDQKFAGIADSFHHLFKKVLIGRGMTVADRVGLVVKVPGGYVRVQDELIVAREPDMEYLGLQMIDPDDRVKMEHVAVLLWPCDGMGHIALIARAGLDADQL